MEGRNLLADQIVDEASSHSMNGANHEPVLTSDSDEIQITLEEELINVLRTNLDTYDEKIEKVNKLIKKGVNIDFQDPSRNHDTALHIALRKRELKIVEILAEKGADINIKNAKKRTPLDIAKHLSIPVEILQRKKLMNQKLSTHQSITRASDGNNNQRKRNDFVHGNIYQLKMLMLFLYRGVSNEYSFRLDTEAGEARKFDDLKFEYTKGGRKEYRLLQAKHRLDESKNITANDLLTEDDGDFSLIKYFFSYHDLKKDKLLKDGSIKDVIICTNIGLDLPDLEKKGIKVEAIKNKDIILDVNNIESKKQSIRYRFSKDNIALLKPKLQNYNVTRLARRFVECLLKNNPMKDHEKNDIFQSYHVILAKEVIDVKNKKFHDRFINNENILEDTKKFRTVFIEEIKKQSKEALTFKDINEAIVKKIVIDEKPVGLCLSKKFGIGQDDSWPKYVISDDEVKDFLDHLVLAVNQPNEDELGKIMKCEIGKIFDLDSITTENVYNKLFMTMLNWMQGKTKDRFLTYKEGKEFFENAIRGIPIWFDVRNPIESFTGRTEHLAKLHTALQSRGETVISQTVSISGLGGIGKSELARKYICEHSQDYDNKILWINAESYQTLAESFRRLAQDKLGISTMDGHEREKNLKSIVEDVYRIFTKGKSLFIFDNAEKYRTQDASDEGIDEFLPSLPSNVNKPYILITSRYQKWENIEVISLHTFTIEEAANFIRKALDIRDDAQQNEIQKLIKSLDGFPLALRQAVTYIKQADEEVKNIEPEREFKIDDYLKEYEKKTRKLLDFPFPDYSSDNYTKTTFTTFQITFDKIAKKKYGNEALEILNIVAYCPPEVPTEVFLNLVKDDTRKLGSIVQILKQYSIVNLETEFLYINREERSVVLLCVHRLVQEVTRINLVKKKREEETIKKALEVIKAYDSKQTYDRPPMCHFYAITEEGKLSISERLASYVWSYAYKYDQFSRDFDSVYGKNKNTPIHLFAISGNKEAIASILRNMERDQLIDIVNKYNGMGYAPIHSAAFQGHKEVVKYLIEEQGVDKDFTTISNMKNTPALVAALGNQSDIVRYLVGEKGADPNKSNSDGMVPIHQAALCLYKDLVHWLANNSNILVKNDDGRNVLHYILLHINRCTFHNSDAEEIFRFLLEKNSILANDADFSGMTPLHFAAEFGCVGIVKMLLDHGVEVNVKSYINFKNKYMYITEHPKKYEEGYTPLNIAVTENHFEIVKLLLQKGAIYNDTVGRLSSLSIAEYRSKVENLLDNIEQIFRAVTNGEEYKVRSLLQHKPADELKAILNARNTHNKTLVSIAGANKRRDIVGMLTEELRRVQSSD